MATSNLIQFLETGEAASAANRRTVETFISGGAITAGDWVMFDASQSGADRVLFVIESTAVATIGNAAAFGVALETIAAANLPVKVVTGGYCAEANVAGAVVAGDALIGPITVAGRADIEVPGTTTGRVIGIALDVDATNIGPVWVCKSF